MPIRVQVVGHGIVEFPDGTSQDVMAKALKSLGPAPSPAPSPAAPRERTWTDTAVDALPAIGGTVGGIIGGAGGTVLGMGVGGVPGAIGGATAGGFAGEAARQLTNRWRDAEAPATPMEAAKDIAIEGGVQGASEAVGGAIAKGVGALGKAVYRGYLKPSLAGHAIDKAREIVETGIRESLPVTAGGEARAARLIGQINAQVSAALKQSGEKVDLHGIAERVRGFAKRTFDRPGSPSVDFDAAMRVADDIDKHASLGIPAGANPTRIDVPVAQGNEVKQGLDRAIGDTGFGVERTAATEARKVGRHAAREAIEAKVPGVGPLNAREAKLIDAMDAIQKAAGREENKNPLTGVSTVLSAAGAGGAAYGASGDPATALLSAAVVRGMITPAVATRAGYLAAKLGASKTFPYGAAAAMRMGVILAQRESEKSGQQ